MLPWKDSSLWSWPQTLPFASQRFSGNLIERFHSSQPPSMGSFCIPPVKEPLFCDTASYSEIPTSNIFDQEEKNHKIKRSFEYTHHPLLSPPSKKNNTSPPQNFRPSTYRLHINNFTHVIHRSVWMELSPRWDPLAYHGPTQGTIPSASRNVLKAHKWKEEGDREVTGVALLVFFHRVLIWKNGLAFHHVHGWLEKSPRF